MHTVAATVPNDLEPFWMPFTRQPRVQEAAAADRARQGHALLSRRTAASSSTARPGLWCCNAGHNREPIVAAIQRQAAELDFAPAFQFAPSAGVRARRRIAALAPGDLDHVFFCNSGSEAVDTALKIALAYHNVRGEGARTRLIGRERGYHGVGFGGISVGGMVDNRKLFGALLAGVDHLPHTYNREQQAFTKGEPEWGAHLADELERIVALHDASTIAAVIVEPMAGSTGVLPPPKGYLKRLREICDKYGILLIFDEVITGFGRLGDAFAAERYGVMPDMITFAKGVTSGTVPMGGVIARKRHLRRLHERARARHRALPRLHLFGASARLRGGARDARPLSRRGPVRARASKLEPKWADAAMSAEGPAERARHPLRRPHRRHRSRLAARTRSASAATRRMEHAFHDHGLMIRIAGDTHRADAAADHERRRRSARSSTSSARHQGGGVGRLKLSAIVRVAEQAPLLQLTGYFRGSSKPTVRAPPVPS